MKVNGINVGCGVTPCERPGWENLDNSPNARLSRWPALRRLLFVVGLLPASLFEVKWPKNIRIHDVRKGLPYADNSLSYVYCSRFLGQLYADEARTFLGECFRVLVPGGILRVAVHDLKLLCRVYVESEDSGRAAAGSSRSGLPADHLLRALNMAPDVAPRGFFKMVLRPFMGREILRRWNYDGQSLAARVREAGFTDVRRCSFRESCIPDIEALDLAGREDVYVEGAKPRQNRAV